MTVMAVLALASSFAACPTYIVDRQAVVDVPTEWESRIAGSRRELEWAEVHWGPIGKSPSRALRGDDRKPGRIPWGLDPKRDSWVACHYQDSAAVLTRRIGRVRSCAFTKGSYALGWRPATMVCRKA